LIKHSSLHIFWVPFTMFVAISAICWSIHKVLSFSSTCSKVGRYLYMQSACTY
jgi:hypothetical protein